MQINRVITGSPSAIFVGSGFRGHLVEFGQNITVAHICKHNKHFSKHNIVLSEHNKLLSKHNTGLSKHIAILSKHNTVFLKHNTMSSKHNTIYRNTTQSLQNTMQISQNTTQYLRNTTQSFPDYIIQDATIQGINPGRYFIYDSYSVLIYIFLLTYLLRPSSNMCRT